MNELLTFIFFPNPTETTLVNLGLASGIIGEALGVNKKVYTLAPTTGKSNFPFKTPLHVNIDKTLYHKNGQVEIDCMLLVQRSGKDILFVFEAKKRFNSKFYCETQFSISIFISTKLYST